ncbi:VENN motif pre-toxin domain-containing protein [Stenotrophomonas indicatrix]|uniref:VENN motif pre-toxin domain-containing protein n=1 Tax=Stenotrophomonas indicatrix TaxID=2045451 RepID=UPI0037340A24
MAAKFLTDTLYGGNASKLSPQEKETILALSQAVGALAGGLSGQDLAGIALNAGIAKNSAENNFLGQNDHARMIHLREKAKRQGGLDKQESLELVLLDAGDQMSAGLLRKALAGESLSEFQAADLATYISRYESQNGPLDLPELQKQFQERAGTLRPGELQGVNPSQVYERPYAGLGDDQKAYKDANYSWVEDIFYRKKGANERLFENALRKSGLEPSRTEDLLPSSMQLRNYFAIQDAQTSSAMASIAFVAATMGGMSEDNRRALTLTMGGIANIAGTAVAGKTGLSPQTGGLGVNRLPLRRVTEETPTTNSVPLGQEKSYVRPGDVAPPKLQAGNDGVAGIPGVLVERGVVKSRVNLANGRTRTTPLRESGAPVSAGFEHVLDGHFNRPPTANRSVFDISPNDLKAILQSKVVVQSPVYEIPGGQYIRVVDVGKEVGVSSLKDGGARTSFIKVFTDKAGNLITAYPVRGGE